MNLLDKTKRICQLYDIKPSRSKGQNFLIDEEIYDQIVEAAEIKPDDTVLEVGPGLGFLTTKLALRLRSGQTLSSNSGQAKSAGKVIAVELDDKLAEYLQAGIDEHEVGNVEVVNQNILDLNLLSLLAKEGDGGRWVDKTQKVDESFEAIKTLPHPNPLLAKERGFKIVANLPYNITSIFIRKFLGEAEFKPELMVLMLQKEVAERICAKPGEMSILAVSVQFYAEAEIIRYVPKENFWPAPEVDSAVIRIRLKKAKPPYPLLEGGRNTNPPTPLSKGGEKANVPLRKGDEGGFVFEKDFFRLVKFGFTAKRKMLKNNLAGGYHISTEEAEEKIVKAGLELKIRAQELSVEDWKKLFGEFGGFVV